MLLLGPRGPGDGAHMDRETAVSLLVAGAVGVGVLFWLYRAEQHRMATVQAAGNQVPEHRQYCGLHDAHQDLTVTVLVQAVHFDLPGHGRRQGRGTPPPSRRPEAQPDGVPQ